LKRLGAAGVLVLLLSFPISSVACSDVACVGNGVELRADFAVDIRHGDKPLPGVSVHITRNTEGDSTEAFSGITSSDGILRVKNLPAGNYWLEAKLLGIYAGVQCFHINSQPSRKAKSKVRYDWGDLVPASREIEGRFVSAKPGDGGTRLSNYLHQVEVPIDAAVLTLRDPFAGKTYSAVSDADGNFSFDGAPDGLYALHIEGATTPDGDSYESADFLIRRNSSAKWDKLLLKRAIADFGGCGGTGLELEDSRAQSFFLASTERLTDA
jgi:hypothetical protein